MICLKRVQNLTVLCADDNTLYSFLEKIGKQ